MQPILIMPSKSLTPSHAYPKTYFSCKTTFDEKRTYDKITIYSYYKNKAEIVENISRQIYNKIVLATKNALEEKQSSLADEKLKAALKAFLYSITDCADMGIAVIRSGTGAIWGAG